MGHVLHVLALYVEVVFVCHDVVIVLGISEVQRRLGRQSFTRVEVDHNVGLSPGTMKRRIPAEMIHVHVR